MDLERDALQKELYRVIIVALKKKQTGGDYPGKRTINLQTSCPL